MRFTAVLFVFALVMPTTSSPGQQAGGGVPSTTTKSAPSGSSQNGPPDSRNDYAAESLVVERLETIYRYSASGAGTREISAVVRIQSDAAARQYGVVTFPFAGDNQRVEIDSIRVRKPDGSTVETPSSDAQEMPQEVTRQAPFYSDLKEKQVPVRNLRVGDRIEYKVRVIDTKPEVPGQFWGQDSFGSWGVILNESIELHVPKSVSVKVWSPEYAPARTETGDEITYRWNGSHTEPTVGKDGKAVQREIDPKGTLPTMAWTTFPSWEAVGAWYRQLEADRIVPDAAVKAKVEELIAGKTTDAEKAQALYTFVATQIRYIGVAFGIGRYQPHPASEVLRNQYGDCKDKHTLLAAMLTAAGLHPEAALIGAGIKLNEEVPSPAAFNHMITLVPVAGAPVWLDTTAELAPYQVLTQVIRNKQALVIPEKNAAKLETTPPGLPFSSFTKFLASGTLTKEGTMKAHMEYTTRGDDEIVMRTLFRQVPRGQWNDLAQRLSQGFGFSGTTSNPDAARPELTTEPVRISYDYEREKTGDWDNHRIVPLFPVVFLSPVDEKNPPKKYPIQLGEPRVETSRSTIKLPAGWGADLPAEVHQKTSFATFDKTYKIDGDTLTTERTIQILSREVPAADWKAYKKWWDASFSDGEPFISLIATETDKKISAANGSKSSQAAELVREAYEQIQRGEINGAEATLGKAKLLDEKQQSLWSTYGFLNFQKRNWPAAIEAYKKEISLFPDTLWVYRSLALAQANAFHSDEAIETLRALTKRDGTTDDDQKMLVTFLAFDGRYEEALPIAESLSAKNPEDEGIRERLGTLQLQAGHRPDGEKTLTAVLTQSSNPALLNDGAYELARAGIELDLAEKSARKAIDLLTAKSKDWKLDVPLEELPKQRAEQNLLIATWDTLGWALYQQGRPDEAEGYIKATWMNQPDAEVGLHLGELEEKRGHKQEALHFYGLALASTAGARWNGSGPKERDAVKTDLQRRIDDLKKSGLSTNPAQNSSAELTKLRTFRVGSKPGPNVLLEYSFVVENGKITEIHKISSDRTIPNAEEMIRRAAFEGWTPQGSTARLVRKGTLNCHSGVCEFVVYPM